MTARVIANPIGEDVVRLPSHAALSDDSGAAQVWVLDPTSMTVSRRAVQLGELTGSDVQILDGLASGDLVAVSGISHLRDGMQVRRYER